MFMKVYGIRTLLTSVERVFCSKMTREDDQYHVCRVKAQSSPFHQIIAAQTGVFDEVIQYAYNMPSGELHSDSMQAAIEYSRSSSARAQ